MTSLLLFAGMTVAVCLAPGPNVMLVIGFALRQGFKPALRANIGISLINILFLALAALGLVALVVASAPLFAAVRYCGAAYLIYLGYKMLRSGLSPQQVEAADVSPQTRPLLQGVITHLGNPKGVLYWSALLPQFLDPQYPLAWQIILLGGFAVIVDFMGMCIYAKLFASASRLLQGSRYFHWIEICAGVFFIISGLWLGLERFEVKTGA
jgi:homoserine/homoserine lactone efflux protein